MNAKIRFLIVFLGSLAIITSFFLFIYTNGINQVNEDRLFDRARLLIQPFSEQAGAFLSQGKQTELISIVQKTVRGSVIYAQIVEGGEIKAKSASDMGLKILPPVEQIPENLLINERIHPAGDRYMDLIQPFINVRENDAQGYARIGLDVSKFENEMSASMTSAISLMMIVLLSVAIVGSLLILKWQPPQDETNQFPKEHASATDSKSNEIIEAGLLVIDDLSKEVRVSNREIQLSQKEYELLRFLASEPGKVFSPQEIIDGIWPENFMSTEDVKKYIYLLRQKIEPESPEPQIVLNVKGFGYRLAV
jgi:DNA-binding winged helix-turn-helix (wHTH) protein